MNKTKVVILCGGQGSRIRDVSEILPKPMLPIGNRPMLWHVMKLYAHYGMTDFVLCLGYKGWVIKEFFLNYAAKLSDITIEVGRGDSVTYHNSSDEEGWKITMVETGEASHTGARIWNARKYLEDCDNFSITYGDGVANMDIKKLQQAHEESSVAGTITGVHPSGRFGEMEIDKNIVTEFNEKPNVSKGLINGGFMMFDRKVIDAYFSEGEKLSLESDVLIKMAKSGQLGVYQHDGFWQCVDTPREYTMLNKLWSQNQAPWKIWR